MRGCSRGEEARDEARGTAARRADGATAAVHGAAPGTRPGEQAVVGCGLAVSVLPLRALPERALERLLAAYGLRVVWLPQGADIPGTHWGEPEAGLIGDTLYVRPDTPVHSALHEACHWICMPRARRETLHTDAGGDDHEENGGNYLGSARAWFERDAEDARDWLQDRDLLPPTAADRRP